MENDIVVEKVENCNLVKKRSIPNGHDCWGKLEFTSEKYIVINNEIKNVYDDQFIIRKENTVLAITYDWNLKDKLEEIKQKEADKLQFKLFEK